MRQMVMENVKLPFNLLVANSEGGKTGVRRRLVRLPTLQLGQEGRDHAGKRRDRIKILPQPFEELHWGRREVAQWSWVTFLHRLLSRSKPRKHLRERGTDDYTLNSTTYTFRGGAGQANQTLCVQLNIFSNFIL